jgi:hypothetical protein
MTGHQKSVPDPRKQACSTMCHVGERKVSSYSGGACQPKVITTNRIQATLGLVSQRPNRLHGFHNRNGRIASRTNGRGRPVNSGKNGLPSNKRGGATIISRRCWIMCTCSRRFENVSRGESSARKTVATPPRNDARRQPSNRWGTFLRSFSQPRK